MFSFMTKSHLVLLAVSLTASAASASFTRGFDETQEDARVALRPFDSDELRPRRALKDDKDGKGGKGGSSKKSKDPFDGVDFEEDCLVVEERYTLTAPDGVEFKGPSGYEFPKCGFSPGVQAFFACLTTPIAGATDPCALYYNAAGVNPSNSILTRSFLTSFELSRYGQCLAALAPSSSAATAYLTRLTTTCVPAFDLVRNDVDGLNKYRSCVEKEGFAINGKWWFNRDQQGSSFRFDQITDISAPVPVTKDAVCAKIDPSDPSTPASVATGVLGVGKTKFELWDLDYLNKPAKDFVKFEVDYNIKTPRDGGGTGAIAYLNVYMRATAASTAFSDCRLDFEVPTPITYNVWKTLTVDINTLTTFGSCSSLSTSPRSIQAYIAANPGAVLGVGNGEYYAFTLDTATTGGNDSNLDVCWSEPEITVKQTGDNTRSVVSVHEFVPITML